MITCYDDQDKFEAAEALLAMSHWQDEQFIRDITNPYDFLRDFDRWFAFAKKRAEQISRVNRSVENRLREDFISLTGSVDTWLTGTTDFETPKTVTYGKIT